MRVGRLHAMLAKKPAQRSAQAQAASPHSFTVSYRASAPRIKTDDFTDKTWLLGDLRIRHVSPEPEITCSGNLINPFNSIQSGISAIQSGYPQFNPEYPFDPEISSIRSGISPIQSERLDCKADPVLAVSWIDWIVTSASAEDCTMY